MVAGEGQSAPAAFRYWAFISYSQRDEVWARKLHRALENYRVPRALVGRSVDGRTVPPRLVPVFRDRDELASDPSLSAALQSALAASDSLVVLCSPHSARSAWVNEEVRLYKRMGRANRIFALIIDHDPGGAAPADVYPPALRFEVTADGAITEQRCEPLAADAQADKDGWTNATLKLIAGILGIRFDELRRRERRRLIRRRLAQAATTIAAAIALCLVYVGLADDGAAIPGAEAMRSRLDHYGVTLFRQVMSPGAMERAGVAVRTTLRGRLLERADEIAHPPFSAWTTGQVVGAAFRDRDAKRSDLQKFVGAYDLVFGAQDSDVTEGKALLATPDDVGNQGRAEPILWAIMGVAAMLERRDMLAPDEEKRFEQYLAVAQRLAETYYPLGDGGWNTAAAQVKPDSHFVYTTALALHMLLQVHDAQAGWRGSPAQLDRMIADTAKWLIAAFDANADAPGWRRSLDDEKEPDSGITLLAYSALGRACAGAGVALPTPLVRAAIQSQIALRRRGYEAADPDVRFDVRVTSSTRPPVVVTVTRLIWYPWAVEGVSSWRRCAAKLGEPPEVIRGIDRSLGHLLADLSPYMLRDVTRAQKPLFVLAETYYGLGKVP